MNCDCFAADAAVFDGHFDGHPIVPGAYLLALVIDAAADWLAAQPLQPLHVVGVVRAKFLRPLGPQVQFAIALRPASDPMQLRFELLAAGAVCTSGLLALAPAGATG
jgi:3-hydroxymyristoyl/3-hydroxydecanoyl-(acyl carrier protein) dehydratase